MVQRLKVHFPDSRLVYLGVIKREEWCFEANQVADTVDMHMNKTHDIKLAPISGLIDSDVHIDVDGVHLSPYGYRLFMDKSISRIIDMWFGPLNHNQ